MRAAREKNICLNIGIGNQRPVKTETNRSEPFDALFQVKIFHPTGEPARMNLLFWELITIVRTTSTTLVLSWTKRSQSLRVSFGMTLTGSSGGSGLNKALTLKSCDIIRAVYHSILSSIQSHFFVIINCIKIFTGFLFIVLFWHFGLAITA